MIVTRPRLLVRLGLVAAATATLLLPTVPSASANTTALRGYATLHFGGYPGRSGEHDSPGLSNAPCEPDSFCGTGIVDPLGAVMVYLDGDSYGDPVRGTSCVAYAKDETLVPIDGVGAVVLHSTGTACFPSEGSSAPPGTDYGNPGFYETTFVVDPAASEGAYAGVTGSGTETFTVAGDVARWSFAGSLG